MWRFAARKTDDGYGVFDSGVNGWRSEFDLTEDQAHEQAMDMDVLYDIYGPRKPHNVRRLDAPVPVKVAEWHAGSVLAAWIRENGEWWNRRELHLAGELAGLGEPGLRFGLIGLRCRAPDLRLWAGVCVRLVLSSLRGGDRQRPGRAVDVGLAGAVWRGFRRVSSSVQIDEVDVGEPETTSKDYFEVLAKQGGTFVSGISEYPAGELRGLLRCASIRPQAKSRSTASGLTAAPSIT